MIACDAQFPSYLPDAVPPIPRLHSSSSSTLPCFCAASAATCQDFNQFPLHYNLNSRQLCWFDTSSTVYLFVSAATQYACSPKNIQTKPWPYFSVHFARTTRYRLAYAYCFIYIARFLRGVCCYSFHFPFKL